MTDSTHRITHSHGSPDQHAGGPPHEPLSESEHPTHHGDHDPATTTAPRRSGKRSGGT